MRLNAWLRAMRAPWACLLVAAVLYLAPDVANSDTANSEVANSETTEPLPDHIVLVLNLISQTRVKPTTGVVIHDSGLVLIPASFVSDGDEIVVLDGGTDIVRNGRPGRVENFPVGDGLAVLFVEGLQRPSAVLSAGTSIPGEVLKFISFPPASFIAKGASPLSLLVRLEATGEKPALKISRVQPLPNVDGPLFDDCGFLSGFNLSSGIPSLEGDIEVNTLLGTEFQDIVQSFGHKLSRTICGLGAELEFVESPPDLQANAEGEEELKSEGIEVVAEITELEEEPAAALETGNNLNPGADSAAVQNEPQSEQSFSWMVALAVVVPLALLLVMFWRRKSVPDKDAPVSDVEEPATEQLLAPTHEGGLKTFFKVLQVEDDSLLPQFEEGCEVLLLLEATTTSGKAFKCSKAVCSDRFQFELADSGDNGLRFDTADKGQLRARIEGISGDDGWEIMVSIPGAGARFSIAGISIRGIPCLPGEKMHLNPGDELVLGSSRFIVKLIGRQERTV